MKRSQMRQLFDPKENQRDERQNELYSLYPFRLA
jgi:hypothetical protein